MKGLKQSFAFYSVERVVMGSPYFSGVYSKSKQKNNNFSNF